MTDALNDAALDQLFRSARTYNAFTGEVSDETLQQLYGLAPALSEGNRAKTLAAPAVAIIGYDMRFFDKLPVLFPHVAAKAWFEHRDEAGLAWVGLRNSSLQTAYLILAARSLGLDCGPMTGFDNAMVDAAFFAGTAVRSNILVNLGQGDPASLYPRSPRLAFDEACQIA